MPLDRLDELSLPNVCRHCWAPMITRDLMVLGGSLLSEPSSLKAFWEVAKCLPRALRQRRAIMSRRRVADDDIAAWFAFTPTSRPLSQVADLPARKRILRPLAETATP